MRLPRRLGLVLVPAAVLALTSAGGSGTGAVAGSPPSARIATSPVLSLHQREIERKVDALVRRMTTAEKLGQLTQAGGDENGKPVAGLFDLARSGQIGSTLGVRGAANTNALQKAALESRLGIPLIFSFDVIHGYRTVFPTPLGESASWDPAMARANAATAAAEAASSGIKWTFAPMADVGHDARWGRVVEGAGEDPYLGAAFAAARVHGFQGSDLARPDRVAATVKHFAAYGAVEAGRDYNTVDVSTERLWNTYLPPYRAAVEAGAATVMTSFNDINGVPSTGNPELLSGLLRHTWGFDGTVISDYTSVLEMVAHGYAKDPADAARLALTAGTDIEMVSTTYRDNGAQLLRDHAVTGRQLDTAVRRVLRLKFLAGLFDHPYADPAREARTLLTPAHRKQARTAAARSMVLLRNVDAALPLKSTTPSVAVVGPLADSQQDMIGSWWGDGQPADAVTPLAGLRTALAGADVTYAQGCDTACTSTTGFDAAVAAAQAAAVTVVVVGEEARNGTGEASSRSDIGLPGRQLDLVRAIAATGKPYRVVLMSGRPLTVGWLADNAPALLEAWHPGTEAGNALADVLLGRVNPGGKLTMGFPRAVGQLPMTYAARSTGRPADPANKYTSKYVDVASGFQYPFGYGLSYTTFDVSAPRLTSSRVRAGGTTKVSVTVKNTGAVAGDEVVQVYVHDKVARITQPVRRLVGFQRVALPPGQSRTLSFRLGSKELGYYDNDARWVVEPGDVDVYAGDSSSATSFATLKVTR